MEKEPNSPEKTPRRIWELWQLRVVRYVQIIRADVGKQLHAQRSDTDMLWLRWGLLSVSVLLVTMGLMLAGCFEPINDAQLKLLCGNPFYLEAEAAQCSALGLAGTFGLCIAVTLYLSVVLLRVPGVVGRLQIAFLALVALGLPGMLCVLWDCVFYVAPMLFSVCLVWLLTAVVPFFRSAHS
ncbi:MAG: hypothetical protein IKJ58_06470 [Akkermansia sp.]|nr:hypothetical protein [Akkermansia sp.]